MAKANYLLCSGEACPIRLTCFRFMAWMNNEDEDAEEMDPAYSFKTDKCEKYEQKTFYGR